MSDDVRTLLRSADGGPSDPDHDDIRRRGQRLVVTRTAAVAGAIALGLAGIVGVSVAVIGGEAPRVPVIGEPAPPPADGEDQAAEEPSTDDEVDEPQPDDPAEDTTDDPPPADDPPSAEELIDDLLRFVAAPGHDTIARLPLADEVALGLGPDLYVTRSPDELADPAAWVIDVEEFRGYAGPIPILDVPDPAADTVVSVGDHPHCANPPVPAPDGLGDHRRVSVQPVLGPDDGCLQWWTVDLFVTPEGDIVAITLDLFGP